MARRGRLEESGVEFCFSIGPAPAIAAGYGLVRSLGGSDSMNWEAIGALGEWAGALAVIATLVYLAIQVRQNSASIRSTAELEASGGLAQFVSRISADENMKRIWLSRIVPPNKGLQLTTDS